jgi:predicted exporter
MSFALFFIVMSLLVALATVRATGQIVNPDMLSLIEVPGHDPVFEAGVQRLRDFAERQHTWIVAHDELETARAAAQTLRRHLTDTQLYASVGGVGEQLSGADAAAFYADFRFQLADDETVGLARRNDTSALVARVEHDLYSNMFSLYAAALAQDPFLLATRFVLSLAKLPPPLMFDRGELVAHVDERWLVLLPARLAASPFDFAYQARLNTSSKRVAEHLRATYGVKVEAIGVVSYASANRELARREIGFVGGLSVLLITLLLTTTFRSVRPFLAVAFTIATGLAAGFLSCLASFGSVHLLTLVGGSSPIGISVDYAFHAMGDSYRKNSAQWHIGDGLEQTLPAVALGLSTSLLGLTGLYVSGFRGLQEIAVFSGGGLIIAFLGLVLCYPLLLSGWSSPIRQPAVVRFAASWARVWRYRRSSLVWMTLVVLVLGATTFPSVKVINDLQLLAADSPSVQQLDKRTDTAAGSLIDSRFILVQADDVEALLQREEQLREVLARLTDQGALTYFAQLSRFVPSAARQMETYALNERLIVKPGSALDDLAQRIGLSDRVLVSQREAFADPAPLDLLELHEWLVSPLAPLGRHLWLGGVGDSVASVVTLSGVSDAETLKRRINAMEGVRVVDNVAEITALFGRYVENAVRGLGVAFVLILGLMVWRFGLKDGLTLMLAPVLAGCLTLALLVLLGEEINLFHIVGFALILGMGMDYVLFLKVGQGHPCAMLAVMLAAISTECAFGLLGVSEVGVIHSFGVTVALGVAVSFLTAPLVIRPTDRRKEAAP